jgi:outer membrane protein assembly factor BamB
MSRRGALVLVFALAPASVSTLGAGNWPQWRGPTLDGRSPEENLPVSWSPEENVAWKLEMPARSGATPIVWDDRIFLNVSFDPEKDDALSFWCVDRNTGKVLWKRPLGGGNVFKYKQHMSTPSPVTDGEHVWVMTGTGILKAFTFAGEEVWSRDLQADYGTFGLKWGYASSPLLFEDALYVQVLHGMETDDPSYVLRFDKKTGKTVWRVTRSTEAVAEAPDAYTTPALLERGGKAEIVIAGGDVLTGHDPETGRELWRAGDLNPERSKSGRIVASPLVHGGMLYAFGKRGPVLAFRAPGEGGVTDADLAWSLESGTDVPTPVTDGEHFYLVNDKGILWCYDAKTGAAVYGPERLPTGTYSASPVLADGKLYATSEAGVTSVVKAGPKFELLAENDLASYTLSSPAISDGQIFLRTESFLYAVGARTSSPSS